MYEDRIKQQQNKVQSNILLEKFEKIEIEVKEQNIKLEKFVGGITTIILQLVKHEHLLKSILGK